MNYSTVEQKIMGSIFKNKDGDGKSGFFDPTFRAELEAMFHYILNTPEVYSIATTPLSLDRASIYRANRDFYQICSRDAKLDRCYWWIMLRLNGFTHPNQFNSDELTESVIMPTPSYFDELLTQYMTTKPVVI